MDDQPDCRIFISYAWKDGADLAQRLEASLAREGFDPWLDRQRLAGGATWTAEIERAIDTCEVVLALLTPGSYVSEICRAEQLRSLRKGKRVIPLLARPGSDIPLHLDARQHRDFTGPSPYEAKFKLLLEDIRGGAGVALKEQYRATRVTYVTTPATVVNYIERPEALRALRDALFAEHSRGPLALTALAGMGGIGKTVLAHALTRDRVVQDAFPDGMVWITVGREQTYDLVAAFREVGKAQGDDLQGYDTLPACINKYKTTLAQKAALIVVDDIWNKSDLEPFLADSQRSRLLFTTRDASIARFTGAQEHTVELLDLEKARELLAAWAGLDGRPRPPQLDAVIEECGNLPLALAIVGAMLRGATPEEWEGTLRLLRKADLTAIADQLPPGQESFFRAVEVSVKALAPEVQERYKALAVLLEDMVAPLPILETLWGVEEAEARRISRHFVDRSLAQREGETGSIRLHDLQLDYVRAQHQDRQALDLIHGAVRLSSHVIERDPGQFASQLVGRLLAYIQPEGPIPAVQQFTSSIVVAAPRPWLRPLRPALSPPGTALVRTLAGHSSEVTGVAVSADGRRAVSASYDKTLKVWDLESGRELRTLAGHSSEVTGVAVSADGRRAVSASGDNTLRVWDLESGRELRTLVGHPGRVKRLALSADGRRAVSAPNDETLKVWDLESGRELRTLVAHSTCVAISANGRRAVSASLSASWEGTLRVWDLESGRKVHTLEGHTLPVNGMAVSADGRRAVSGSRDGTLKVWVLERGRELHTLAGHSDWGGCVTMSADGRRAVSASHGTLKVWDLDIGRELRTLAGYCGPIQDVAMSADGRRAVSASDATLKVWHLESGCDLRPLAGHFGVVWDVAASVDGRRVVSASVDKTLKVWDPQNGRELRTLAGHSGVVYGVAMSADGRRAVSASYDKTLKVWDLESGQELGTLAGHSGAVHGVALSADGRRAVSASNDGTLKVWDLEASLPLRSVRRLLGRAGRELRTLAAGHSGELFRVAVNADGRWAVSTSEDKTLKVWDLENGRELRTLEGHSDAVLGVAMSADGRRAVSASYDKTLKVWDLESGRELRTLTGHRGGVDGVAVSPEGQRAVSASGDNTLKVWELELGALVATFTCDAHARCCVFVTARTIVAGDLSGRVHFLSLELKHDI